MEGGLLETFLRTLIFLTLPSLQLGTIHKVRTLKYGDFQTPNPPLYASKEQNDVIKTINLRFCLDLLPPPECTYFMDGPLPDKTQTGVFPISVFLVNPLKTKIVRTLERVLILT